MTKRIEKKCPPIFSGGSQNTIFFPSLHSITTTHHGVDEAKSYNNEIRPPTNDADDSFIVSVMMHVFQNLTDLLSPLYILLSLIAVASRYSPLLKVLASHGKALSASPSPSSGRANNREGIFIERKKSSIQKWSTWLESRPWCWVSKRCFVHFYIVGLVSLATTFAIMMRAHPFTAPKPHGRGRGGSCTHAVVAAPTCLLLLHLLRRVYECLRIQQYDDHGSSKMHVAGYALGIGHYAVLPLVFLDSAGGGDGRTDTTWRTTTGATFTTITLLVMGAMLNVWLQYEQYQHHVLLAALRSSSPAKAMLQRRSDGQQKERNHRRPVTATSRPETSHSPPPSQRWFRWVLCPHYLAEILIYLSFAILLEIGKMNWDTTTVSTDLPPHPKDAVVEILQRCRSSGRRFRHWMLLVWVTTNLTVSALNTADWYRAKYPQQSGGMGHHPKAALIPRVL